MMLGFDSKSQIIQSQIFYVIQSESRYIGKGISVVEAAPTILMIIKDTGFTKWDLNSGSLAPEWPHNHTSWKGILNIFWLDTANDTDRWTASSEFGAYRLCEQRRFRRAWASAQSRQNLRCSLI